ncbi:hypothetical protein [Limosilactobacillus gorillae]|uniref:hypothetical protein n=1 Tax=Limosilactobacillus gorillae TaxID=1450649 RepID=UPI000A5DE43F|nr:hypothetical protein [Limosilactobacillus gorillae]
MRKLDYINSQNDEYKFGDTSAVLTYTAFDDDTKVVLAGKTLTFKIKDDTAYVASAPGQLNGDGTVSLKTADIKDLTPGTYFVELWISVDNTTAIYPSKGFVSFTINESTQTVTNKYRFLTLTELINNFNKAVADVKAGPKGVDGKDGATPTIDKATKHWLINGTDTGCIAEGLTGAPGKDGINGSDGAPGKDGISPTITINSVKTLEAGQPVTVTNSGDSTNVKLDIAIPQGDQGRQGIQGVPGETALSLKLGTVSTGDVGAITNVGTDSAQIWNVVLPKAKDGRDATITIGKIVTGTTASVINSGTATNAVLDFTLPQPDMSKYMLADDVTKSLAPKVDKSTLSSYYTAAQVDSLISNKADVSALATYASKGDINALIERVKKLEMSVTKS